MKTTAKDFFLYIAAIVALYTSAVSLITVVFQTINYLYPDALNAFHDPYSTGMRWAIASLIIVFPVFLSLTALINSDLARNPDKIEIGIRKWLIYLTLFIAGVTIVTDLIVLLNTYLSGEITVRFILKVIAILVIAGVIFSYYIYELKRSALRDHVKTYLWVSIALVLAALIGGFIIIGSPAKQRAKRFDERRVSDLNSIQWQVVNFWQTKSRLPRSFSELEDPFSGFIIPTDPESKTPYEYSVLSNSTFKLCATFKLSSSENSGYLDRPRDYSYAPYMIDSNWQHPEGYHCFERKIDPEKYPPLDKHKR